MDAGGVLHSNALLACYIHTVSQNPPSAGLPTSLNPVSAKAGWWAGGGHGQDGRQAGPNCSSPWRGGLCWFLAPSGPQRCPWDTTPWASEWPFLQLSWISFFLP